MRRQRKEGNPMAQIKSLMYKVFSLAMDGVTVEQIRKFCRKFGSNGATHYIKVLRSGNHYGRQWEVEERDGYIKVKVIQQKKSKSKKG